MNENIIIHDFPYKHIECSLPNDLYEKIKIYWNTKNQKDIKQISNNKTSFDCTQEEIYRPFHTFMFDMLSRYCGYFLYIDYPKLGTSLIDLDVKLTCYENLPSNQSYLIKKLHLDSGNTFINAYWYYKDENEIDDGGDLLLVNPITKDSKLIKYSTNKLILLPNLPTSWHGTTARKKSIYPRRYMHISLFCPKDSDKLHNYQSNDVYGFRKKFINYYK